MPLKKAGKKVLSKFEKEYGDKKDKEVFYASMNSGKLPRSKMEGKKPKHKK